MGTCSAGSPAWRQTLRRRYRILSIVLALCVGGACAGCDRVKNIFVDRAKADALRGARDAIDKYSKASEQANVAHRKVIEAFSTANKAGNLADYKTAMREQVIPRMTVFVERLEAMQVGTPELKKVHGILINAYRRARADITTFVDELQSPDDLKRFDKIRKQLQGEVTHYRNELASYYTTNSRMLRGGGPTPAPSTPNSATQTNQ